MSEIIDFEIVAGNRRQNNLKNSPLSWPSHSPSDYEETEEVKIRRAKSALAKQHDINSVLRRCHARLESKWYQGAKTRLAHLSNLSDNWNSYGAEAPNQRALYRAREALEILTGLGVEPTGIVPSAENGIALIFKNGNRHADIEFFNDGDVAYLTDDGVNAPQAYDITADKGSIGIALHEIKKFLIQE